MLNRKSETRNWIDLVSIELTTQMQATLFDFPFEERRKLTLLIVRGNDTTRNSMSAGMLVVHRNPAEYDKLCNDHSLVDNMVPEIIRYRTPLPDMRRTANQDIEIGGKQIRKGDQPLMWYGSGNRDEEAVAELERLRSRFVHGITERLVRVHPL